MTLRLFAAIWIPEEQADRLAALMRGVPAAHWRPRENLHVTLRFFGAVAEPVAEDLDLALEAAADRIAPFDLAIQGAGWFGKEAPHTLWMGLSASPPLARLAAGCERAARDSGLKPETRAYAPHVTMAACAGAGVERVQAFCARHALFQLPAWRVEEFGLYSSWTRESAPSHFRLEAQYALRG